MADTESTRRGAAELKESASKFIELGLGAVRRNDTQSAQIYLGMAATVFEKVPDANRAETTRAFARTLK